MLHDVCRKCGKEIKHGDPIKVLWNSEQDEHINCPVGTREPSGVHILGQSESDVEMEMRLS